MRKPLVSIVMPVRNAGEGLAATIAQVLNQSFGDFEFLIADDSSTDDTSDIIAKAARTDPRIVPLCGPGEGVAAVRRILHLRATGRFIMNWDADDHCPPHRLGALLEASKGLREPFLLGSAIRVFVDGQHIRDVHYPTANNDIRRRLRRRFGRSVICCASTLGSTNLFVDVPIRNKFQFMSDWDQFLRISESTPATFANVPDTLYDYRLTRKSMSLAHMQRAVGAVFLRECERRRLKALPEPASVRELPRHLLQHPTSILPVIAEFPGKLVQQAFYP